MGSTVAVKARLEDAFRAYDDFWCPGDDLKAEMTWMGLRFAIEEVLDSKYITSSIRKDLVDKLKEEALNYYGEDYYLRLEGPAFDLRFFFSALTKVVNQAEDDTEIRCVIEAMFEVRCELTRRFEGTTLRHHAACEIELLRALCRSAHFTPKMAMELCIAMGFYFYDIFCDEVGPTKEFVPVFGYIFENHYTLASTKTWPMTESIRDAFSQNAESDASLLKFLSELTDTEDEIYTNIIAALTPGVHRCKLYKLSRSSKGVIRYALAMNKAADIYILEFLTQDENMGVKMRAIQTLFEIEVQSSKMDRNSPERARALEAREVLKRCKVPGYC